MHRKVTAVNRRGLSSHGQHALLRAPAEGTAGAAGGQLGTVGRSPSPVWGVPALPFPRPPRSLLRAPTALFSCPLSLFLPRSNREDAHIRVKRYRQSINRFPHFQTKACRFGTCTVHWLVDELHRAAVNDRNDAAPPNKISPQGYGRRRRSLPERRSPARSPRSGRRPRTRRAQPLASILGV